MTGGLPPRHASRVDDRGDLAGFDELLENTQVLSLCRTTNTRIRWRTKGDSKSALI